MYQTWMVANLFYVDTISDPVCIDYFEALLFNSSWRRSLSYRNQLIDLLWKSMDWFLYDGNLRHERVNKCIFRAMSNIYDKVFLENS